MDNVSFIPHHNHVEAQLEVGVNMGVETSGMFHSTLRALGPGRERAG